MIKTSSPVELRPRRSCHPPFRRAVDTQLIVGIIMLHNWWTDIKKHASNAAGAVGDVFDRRALTVTKHAQEEQDRAQKFDRAGPGLGQPKAGVAGDSAGAPGGNGADEGARQQQEDAGLPDKVGGATDRQARLASF